MKEDYKLVIILHDIRSVINVGAIFRTADAIGVTKIYLTGYTPIPIDRFGRVRGDIEKSALGAEKSVLWEHFEDVENLIKQLMKDNFEIIAVEQDENSIDYKKFEQKQNTVFLFGNEVVGISKKLLQQCGKIIEVPMKGKKESLNISVSVGVVLFRVLDK